MFFVSRSGYYGSYNAATVASIMFIVGIVLALICTILSVILITPEKRRAALPKFFKFLHDLFNVRWLLIEKIFKFFYIFFTLSAVIIGFLLLFTFSPYSLLGLLLMLAGPVFIRLIHESLMLMILTVKNVISINNKLSDSGIGNNPFSMSFSAYKEPAQTTAPPAASASGVCVHCGTPIGADADFCSQCGQKQR